MPAPPLSVLLIDHNVTFTALAAQFLQRLPIPTNVRVAHCGPDGLAQAEQGQPDLVLLELFLPSTSGLNLIAQLRQAAPNARLIALTLCDETVFRPAVLALGADEFVAKREAHATLWPAIEKVLRRDYAGSGAQLFQHRGRRYDTAPLAV